MPTFQKWPMATLLYQAGETVSYFRIVGAAPWSSSLRQRNTCWKHPGPNSCLPDSRKEPDWWSLYWIKSVSTWMFFSIFSKGVFIFVISSMPTGSEWNPDAGLEGGTAEQLGASLARASPELRQCVASCKHIAETARQQNSFQNVRPPITVY